MSITLPFVPSLDKYTALPPELHLRIATYLDHSDLRVLISASRLFYNLFARDVLLMGLRSCMRSETVLYAYSDDYPFHKLFRGSFMERLKLEPKFKSRPEQVIIQRPFVIRGIHLSKSFTSSPVSFPSSYFSSSKPKPSYPGTPISSSSSGSIRLKIYQPPFFRKDYHTKDLDIFIDHSDEVYLFHSDSHRPNYQSRDWDSGAPDLEEERFKVIELEDVLGNGKFLGRVTGTVLRANWQCPECGDGKYTCPDCGGAWDRWAHYFLSVHFGFWLKCVTLTLMFALL